MMDTSSISIRRPEARMRKTSRNTSGYVGVTQHKVHGRWQASYKGEYLGLYDTPEEAARAYDDAVIRAFVDGKLTNFPVKSRGE